MSLPRVDLNVREFFKGKSVLITGTTGFVGKVLLEKLLRDLPEVRVIYCLIRNKPKKTLHQRLMGEILSA